MREMEKNMILMSYHCSLVVAPSAMSSTYEEVVKLNICCIAVKIFLGYMVTHNILVRNQRIVQIQCIINIKGGAFESVRATTESR